MSTYAGAGVDIDAGDRAVELMKASVARATRPEVVGGLGGFAGLFRLDIARYRQPLLATSTDGVGTKTAIARAMSVHDTIGIDLVGMVVDDLVVCGAEPLFMTDYIACGAVDPQRIAAIVAGVAEGCRQAGCALIGGETAEHPGLMAPDDFDIAGAGTGVVEEDAVLGPHRVEPGDVVVAMASSGLHANGYSLVRHVFFEQAGWTLERHVDDLGRTLGEELLEPTRVYSKACLDAVSAGGAGGVHAFAHITGGGLAANLARVIPQGLDVEIDRSAWAPPPVFGLVGALGGVERGELERTLNMGVGMVAIVAPSAVDDVCARLAAHGVTAWIAGSVRDAVGCDAVHTDTQGEFGSSIAGGGRVRLVGDYRSDHS